MDGKARDADMIGCPTCNGIGRSHCEEHKETEEEELGRLFRNLASKVKREYTIQALEMWKEQEEIIATLKAKVSRLEETFRHCHVAKYVDDKLTDECKECGLDIRNEIHRPKDLKEIGGSEGEEN